MAINTTNGPKANPGEIKGILRFLKELLPNKLVKAISFLLHPCCTISGTGVAVCTATNVFDLTITLGGSLPSFPALPIPFIISITGPGIQSNATGTYTAPNTITGEVIFDAGITDTTQDVTVQITYPTSADGSIGVYHSFTIPGVVFDGNPCD